MFLKNLVISASILSTFGLVSFAQAATFTVKCPKGNGTGDCVSVSNNSGKNYSALPITCETANGSNSWTVSINAHTENLCLDVEHHCKPSGKIKMTINNGSTVKTCDWLVNP